ncbi:relaxase/mobilization nuclease domain-containing protein [Roseibium sp.]|uniref:relaxase/mobilization nuclease domain-containing protein n=1 Tax=Roseibium sp. TaxID=1936156 RepID=UPI0039F0737B
MQRLRNATSADAAALHIHLSPSRSMSDDELVRAAEIVIRHFDAEGYPAAMVVHEKQRQDGEGDRHGHLVLGRVSPELEVLESGFEKIRLETAARIIEHELGEAPTLGRHHKSALKWLRANGRKDVADWLEQAYGAQPTKPQSAASPDSRQGLARQGIDLPETRSEVRAAWARGGSEAARDAGYVITAGRKADVFIVTKDGVEIGALDRLLGEKRALVRTAMEAEIVAKTAEILENPKNKRIVRPVETRSSESDGDPSRKNRSSKKALAAAHRFLDQQEAELTEKVTALSRPVPLPDPDDLVGSRIKLKKAADELAHWDQLHGPRLAELRKKAEMQKPRGFFAWLTGRTARWVCASKELTSLLEERVPLHSKIQEVQRIVRVLTTVQETRQLKYESSRQRQRERHKDVLGLIPHARDVLSENPGVALGGGKALARAARKRRRQHLDEQVLHVPERLPNATAEFSGRS